MIRRNVWLSALLSLLIYVRPAAAHHSFAAEYDSTKTITVKGTVAKVAWVNPHAYVYIAAKDPSGKPVTWAFETLSPNALAIRGWSRTSLTIGEEAARRRLASRQFTADHKGRRAQGVCRIVRAGCASVDRT
jgi:hypothetical protein